MLLARDGCLRDVAGLHGTYRKVEETLPAIALVGEFLAELGAGPCLWCLDRPVSNSGRLASAIREMAEARGWDWSVELMFNPDAHLVRVGRDRRQRRWRDPRPLRRAGRTWPARRSRAGSPGPWVVNLSGA